jgi:cell cycle protein kinase DBF2
MTTNPPLSPLENQEFRMPAPPPPLVTRSTNDYYDHPSTPSRHGFVSPQQTPQGSPSKHHMPPGAHDLPNVFDNAMKLMPAANNGSPARNTRQQVQQQQQQQQQQAGSPSKSGIPIAEDRYAVDFPNYGAATAGAMPGSPTRKSNKENTPPGMRPPMKKESSFVTQAAQSRQEAYKTRDEPVLRQTIQRGLSPEDIEKCQKASVKRLANVTQLCKCFGLEFRMHEANDGS